MATKTDRLGETRMMNCGIEATIIRYGRCDDIDVCFEDGTVVEHKTYKAFKKGGIANPNIKAFTEARLGETHMMNCGMEATVIRYNTGKDIEVRFEDGVIVEHKRYRAFENGNIAHPSTTAENRLGETRMMNCGMKATIIRYGKYTDIDVRFEDGVVYSVMPSGSKILVPFTLSVAESITSTTVVMRASMDKSFENVPVFEFGVYREDGTLVDTVKNDRDGNIVIETKDYALGRYYVQEKAGTAVNIIYDTSKYYFTVSEVQEKVTGVNVSHGNKQVMYYTLVKPSLLTGNNLQLSGFSGVTVTDSEGNPHTLRAYCADLSRHVPHGTAKQVYINPTDAEINEARGNVYAGPQENLSDAIRCILYFENKNAQSRIWDLLNRGKVIDTSRVKEIPADFQFAIITPPSFSEQPLIVPLADIRVEDEVVMEEITTGIVRKRVVTLETPVSVFENCTSSKTYVIKQDEDGNVLYGAKLSLWKDGKLVRSFTTTAVTFGAVLADGDYILREDEAPYGYEKAADISFQVKDHIAYQNGAAVSENTIVMTDKALPTLTVSKKVTGSFGDKYKDFKFYLTLDDDSITSLSYMKGDAIETVTRNADNQFEFTLSHGESVVFADLPVGTGYTVTEPDAKAEGYEVTADGATGTIQENGSTVLFTNNRNMVVPTELDTNMAVFEMILAAGCVLLIGYGLKRRKK